MVAKTTGGGAAAPLDAEPPFAPLTDDELTAMALAAEPVDTAADDAVCLWDMASDEDGQGGDASLLPAWYMPAPMHGARRLRGWRRRVAIGIIATFLLIDAYGLCSTYGPLAAH